MKYHVPHLFNIRVYGILITPEKKVLLSDEYVLGRLITKFPGGGLQFGEGTIDCLRREFLEECNLEIDVRQHFYTTGFFQPAFHDPSQQVLSIYYLVEPKDKMNIKISTKPFDFECAAEGSQSFRLVSLQELHPDMMTLPIDKHVVDLLRP